MVGDMDSGLTGFLTKSVLKGKSFLSLGIGQPWEGRSLQHQQGPRCLGIRNTWLVQGVVTAAALSLPRKASRDLTISQDKHVVEQLGGLSPCLSTPISLSLKEGRMTGFL